MFKTGADYKYATLKDTIVPEYKMSPNDRFTMMISTNNGYKLIDYASQVSGAVTGSTSGGSGGAATSNLQEYSLDRNGNVRLPILGEVYLKDKTIAEAEKLLENKFSEYYKFPFIQLKVINRRVLIFPGEGGAGSSLVLQNDNTTLLEALATSGGVRPTGKAFRIKLIRGTLSNPQVFLIDFSTVEAMKSGDIVLQANDIIYVEPIRNTSQGILAQISPVIGIITALLLVYQITKTK